MAEQQDQRHKVEQLTAEKNDLETTHPLAAKLLETEIARIQSGGLDNPNFIELHQAKTKVEFRVKIPNKEFPQLNFVGKILGQGGENVKRLQETTGVRIAVLGAGSMKDKKKQEELRQQGGKYAHLNHDLHVWFEAQGHPVECYQRIAHAFQLIHPFITPDPNELLQLQQQQANGGAVRGRGGPRGAGGMRGAARGGMGGMGAPAMGAGRGGMAPMARGAGGPMRGAPAGRGAPGQLMSGAYGAGARPPVRGGPAARAGRGGPVAGGRGAARGGGMSGMSARGGASAPLGRGRGGAASAPSMLQPSYGSESYEYEAEGAQGYGGGYGEEMGQSYDDSMGMADAGYGVAPADPNEQYQYESYGQAEDASGYGGYDTGAGWGGDGMADAAGYGKAAPPTRGALSNYRSRPY